MNKFRILLMLVAITLIGASLSCEGSQTSEKKAGDDIVYPPGLGPAYRADVHQSGEVSPWAPINSTEVVLGDYPNAPQVSYRDYIETEAGQTRNNIFMIETPTADINAVNLEAINVPNGIKVKKGDQWRGIGGHKTILMIEISRNIKPGEYTFNIRLEINGKDYGEVPCTIKVLE